MSFYKPNKIVPPLYVHNKIGNRLRSQSSLLIEIAEVIIFEKSQNISLSKNLRKTNAIISIKKSKKTYSLSYSRNLKFCPVLAARQLSDLSKKTRETLATLGRCPFKSYPALSSYDQQEFQRKPC